MKVCVLSGDKKEVGNGAWGKLIFGVILLVLAEFLHLETVSNP